MPMKIKKGTAVFVEPLNLDTNAVLSENLSEDWYGEVVCSDGVVRKMWGGCGDQLLTSLIAGREKLGLAFNLWQRWGVKGELRKCSPEDIGFLLPVSA